MRRESRRGVSTPIRAKSRLARLARDTKGNTLAVVAAGLIPLTAMIGSGVDMSRAYMAKTRLQSACDAAALAGRRVMTNDTVDSTVINEARRYFNFNFPQALYNTAAFTAAVTRPSSGTVRVAASTTIPTTVMSLFGFNTLPLDVSCDASLNFVNTDILLVLDTTGSMDWDINGNYTASDSARRITALRDAVMALYDELTPVQTQLEANGLRLRYGIVPYSTTVNVGSLIRGMNSNHLGSDVEYQTRVARYLSAIYNANPQPPQTPVTQIYGSSISQSDCDKYGRNVSFSGFTPSATTGGGPPPITTWTRTFSNNEAAGVDWGWSGAPDASGSTRSCRRRYVQTDTTYTTVYGFTTWAYEADSLDTSQYKLGNSVTFATANGSGNPGGTVPTAGTYNMIELAQIGTGVTTTSASWNGCIEERDTVSTITSSSGYSIPPNAYDLNINLIPYSDETRWRPMWPRLEYRRAAGSITSATGTSMASAPCPVPARRLQAWTRSNMESYIQTLDPGGNTYHDSGMIWGARLISNAGIFADSPDTFGGMPVSRHVIFMSDGQMDTDDGIYGLYGIERNDMRISGQPVPSSSNLDGRHMQRFKMTCNALKGMNVSIWVIAFGTTLSAEMQECASNSSQASTAANRDALIARFREIGSNIGALRLTL
ncbi:MAG: TadE/TadG family type IV pilus assembly protein [Sphingosinicella sp.]